MSEKRDGAKSGKPTYEFPNFYDDTDLYEDIDDNAESALSSSKGKKQSYTEIDIQSEGGSKESPKTKKS